MHGQLESTLVKLKSGQIVGQPITRRELKRQLKQEKQERRALYRSLRHRGLNYQTRGLVVRETTRAS